MALGAIENRWCFWRKRQQVRVCRDAENLQSNQPHAPGRRRRFYLAVHGRRPRDRLNPIAERATKPARARWSAILLIAGRSSLARCTNRPSELRRERRKIDDATDARRTIRLHFDGRQNGARMTASACGGNSVARDHAMRSNEATVRSSACRVADHWREHRDVVLGLRRQRPACRQMLVVARRARIVGGEEPWRAIAIEHLAKIGGAGENVVVGIVGVCAETMAGAQFGVCLRHDLHQPHRALSAKRRAHRRRFRRASPRVSSSPEC